MPSKVTPPVITRGDGPDNRPALLLRVGPRRWPVLIAPEDFSAVQEATGFSLWGIQGRNVVVGDDEPTKGRPAVARLLAGIDGDWNLQPAFRDGNPLNLLRSNLGIHSRRSAKTWWLELRHGERDSTYNTHGELCRIPQAILRHRAVVPEDRPTAVAWPKRENPVRRSRRRWSIGTEMF